MSRESHSDSGDRESPGTAAETRNAVRDRYGSIAAEDEPAVEREGAGSSEAGGCCDDSATSAESSCCGNEPDTGFSETLGYDPARLETVPEGANLGLGCGNPTALAELEAGETVLDLGAGGGFDCFLAAQEVGPDGRVIGVDMTPEMVERARRNAERSDVEHVEFRLGEIEHLPVADGSVDAIISNCVVNLSPSKEQVFAEAFRVCKPGGRLAISDIAMTERGREELDHTDLEQYASCISGAATIDRLHELLTQAGFESVTVRPKAESEEIIDSMYDHEAATALLHSVLIRGRKPTERD